MGRVKGRREGGGDGAVVNNIDCPLSSREGPLDACKFSPLCACFFEVLLRGAGGERGESCSPFSFLALRVSRDGNQGSFVKSPAEWCVFS